MTALLKIIIFLFLFVGANVVGYLGADDRTFCAMIVAISILPMVYYIREWTKENINWFILFFFSCFFLIYSKLEESAPLALMVCLGPLIMYFSLPNIYVYNSRKYYKFWRFVAVAILVAFLLNSGISIAERLTGEHLFGLKGEELAYQMEEVGVEHFRSTGLYGHPLKNALMTSVFMSFILTSALKKELKFSLWFIGYITLLCFNERASIVGNALLLLVYVGRILVKQGIYPKHRFKYLLATLVLLVSAYFLIMERGFAGRLLSMGLLDESSSETRIAIWEVFNYHNLEEFLYFHSTDEMYMFANSVGVLAIENFWLVFLFRFGWFFLVPYIILHFLLIKNAFAEYPLFETILINGTFWLLASVNNSLAIGFVQFWYFLLLSIVFTPSLFSKIIKSKHLEIINK